MVRQTYSFNQSGGWVSLMDHLGAGRGEARGGLLGIDSMSSYESADSGGGIGVQVSCSELMVSTWLEEELSRIGNGSGLSMSGSGCGD